MRALYRVGKSNLAVPVWGRSTIGIMPPIKKKGGGDFDVPATAYR
jgi:hypothetical protein